MCQRPSRSQNLPKIIVAPSPIEISRLREPGHVPYPCRKFYLTDDKKKPSSDEK